MSQCYRTGATYTGFAQPRYTSPVSSPTCTVSAPYTKRVFPTCSPATSYVRASYPCYTTRSYVPRPIFPSLYRSYNPYYSPYAQSHMYTHYSSPTDTACAVGFLGAALLTAAFFL